MDRSHYLLGDLSRETSALEIGPSYNPLLTKAAGWAVQTVDHASKTELQEKYRAWGVDVSRMEEVDYIWTAGPLHEAVPEILHGRFGRIVASHVIEHIPDLLGFLRSAALLLAEDGQLALAVPDRRFCFDYFRPATLTSDVLERHETTDGRHTTKSAFETYFYNANADNAITWWNAPAKAVTLHHDWATAQAQWNAYRNAAPGTYIDMHASSFSPCSFELIVTELAALDLCDLTVQQMVLTNAFEFFVVLERGGSALRARDAGWLAKRRTELLHGVLEETHWQVELLRKSRPTSA